ncbi:hypothetical protein LPJ73_001343, partial [Coemansia sp. RSA 2703]
DAAETSTETSAATKTHADTTTAPSRTASSHTPLTMMVRTDAVVPIRAIGVAGTSLFAATSRAITTDSGRAASRPASTELQCARTMTFTAGRMARRSSAMGMALVHVETSVSASTTAAAAKAAEERRVVANISPRLPPLDRLLHT